MMSARYVVLLCLLLGGRVSAVDEDYYIPYTDNYGYVYDLETGQYIKKEQPPGEENTSVAEHSSVENKAVNANGAPQNKLNRTIQGFPDYLVLIMIVGMALAVIGFYLRLRRRKAIL